MPYKHETQHLRLQPEQDRRRKLSEEQKEEIRQLYADGKGSHRALADRYHVSKSTIGIIVNPSRAAKVQNRIREHWRDYADREKHTGAIRDTRRYKQELYLKGALTEEGSPTTCPHPTP